MAGETVHWLKNHHLAKTVIITGEHLETRVKEEAPNEVLREDTSGTEGNSPAPMRLRCVTKGTRGTVLGRTASAGTPMQKNSCLKHKVHKVRRNVMSGNIDMT